MKNIALLFLFAGSFCCAFPMFAADTEGNQKMEMSAVHPGPHMGVNRKEHIEQEKLETTKAQKRAHMQHESIKHREHTSL